MFNKTWWITRISEGQYHWKVYVEYLTPQIGTTPPLSFPDATGLTLPSGSTLISASLTVPSEAGSNNYSHVTYEVQGPVNVNSGYCKNETAFDRHG